MAASRASSSVGGGIGRITPLFAIGALRRTGFQPVRFTWTGWKPVLQRLRLSRRPLMRAALVLALLLPLPLAAQPADAKRAAIQFLASLQQPDGGFIAAPPDK